MWPLTTKNKEMYRIILLVSLALAISFQISGQSYIVGRVYDEHSKRIEGFNVVLLNKLDSTVITGGFFCEDKFEIKSRPGEYLLHISAISYRDTLLYISIKQFKLDVDTIYLANSNVKLKDVVIRAKKILYSQEDDKMIINVENSILSEAGSVIDVLRKSVKLKVDSDNEITVLGKGKAQIYLNGRKIASKQALSMIASEEIKKIEIIENPSSEYSADALAVINIISRKDSKYGHALKIINTLSKRNYWHNSTNLQLSQHSANNNLYASYSFSNKKYFYQQNYIRDYKISSSPTIIIDIDEKLNIKEQHFFRLTDNYQLNRKNIIGVSLNGGFYKGNYNTKNYTKIYNNVDEPENLNAFSTYIKSPFKRNVLNGLITYTRDSIGNNGAKFILSVEKYLYKNEKDDFISDSKKNENQNKIKSTFNLQAIDVNVFVPLNENLNLKSGFSYSYNNHVTDNMSKTSIREFTEEFFSSEYLFSGFGLLNYKAIKWRVNLGLRIERMDRRSLINKVTIVDNKSIEWLPNMMLTKIINENLKINLSYTRKIQRPSFQDLNPSIHYIDSLSYKRGNPKLINERVDSYNMKITYMKYASLSFYYKTLNNAIIWTIESPPYKPLASVATKKNIAKHSLYGIDLILPYKTKYLTTYLAAGLNKTDNRSGELKYLNKISWYLSSGIDVNMPLGVKANLSVMYFSDGVNGIWTYKSAWQCDASLHKSIMNNKLNLSLSFQDIFRSKEMKSSLKLDKQNVKYNYYNDIACVKFRISYKFNNMKNKPLPKSVLTRDANRIIVDVK